MVRFPNRIACLIGVAAILVGVAITSAVTVSRATHQHVSELQHDQRLLGRYSRTVQSLSEDLADIRTATTRREATAIDAAHADFVRTVDIALAQLAEAGSGAVARREAAQAAAALRALRADAEPFANQVRRVRASLSGGGVQQITHEAERGNAQFVALRAQVARLQDQASAWEAANTLAHIRKLEDSAAHTRTLFISLLGLAVCLLVLSVLGQISARRHLRDRDAALREADAASQAKSAFLAVMSHEIRTPLNGVLGMAEGLRTTRLTPGQAEMVDVILRSGNLLLNLLNDLLDLSRVEAGKIELSPAEFRVEDLVEDAMALYAEIAREKGLEVTADIAHEAAGGRRSDAFRLRQVLGNLIGNAVKFTETGAVRVEVSAPREGWLRFAVTDTGQGFGPQVQARLFSQFQQADASTTRKYGGSGLGLAICRELVELLGGSIGCVSQVGEGSTFWFEIPAESCAPAAAPAPAPARDICLEGLRVLCAEDNPTNQRVLTVLLAAVGAELTLAVNGEEAVALHARDDFDVVLMDMHMPVMDGLEATRRIRAAEQAGGMAPAPIIALTANALPQHVQACLEAGMVAHVAKPIQAESLFDAIARAIDCPARLEQGLDGRARRSA